MNLSINYVFTSLPLELCSVNPYTRLYRAQRRIKGTLVCENVF